MDLLCSFSLSLTTLGCLLYLKDNNSKACFSLFIVKIANFIILNTVNLSPFCELLLFVSLDSVLLLTAVENYMKITILTDLLMLFGVIIYPITYQPMNEFDICVCSNLYCISVNTERRYWLFLPNITLFTILVFSRYALI